MLSEKQVLVVEGEFLVALDMQRILERAGTSKTVFARSIEEAATLDGRLAEFDLAIIEMQGSSAEAIALSNSLHAAGVPIVVTSGDATLGHGVASLDGAPVLSKPFGESDLLQACTVALTSTSPRR